MPDSLWDFSLSVYRRVGVEAACLRLQDRIGADVNLLMHCCWLGRAFAAPELARIRAEVAPWHNDIVQPLRAVRRALKPRLGRLGDLPSDADALRKRIADEELDAEHIEQRMLEALAELGHDRSLAIAAHNLVLYVSSLGPVISQNAWTDLATLLRAAFPDQPAEAVPAALADARGRL